MKEKLLFKFYVLIDPKDNQIKYVGRTIDENNRFRHHIYESKKENKNKKQRWIVSLTNKNLLPKLKIIYFLYCNLNDAIQIEKMLVKKLLKRGYKLKNEPDNYLGAVLTGKIIYQYDLNGNFIKTFANANQAYIITGIRDGNINKAVKKEGLSAGGYMWSYIKKDKINPYNNKWRESKGKPVVAINKYGEEKEFLTSRVASKELNLSYKNISAVLHNKQKSVKGYIFKFKL